MSPGPSLAFIVTVSLTRGRHHGVTASFGHGIGILLWAYITVLGLAGIIVTFAYLMSILQIIGIVFLIYIGVQTALHKYDLRLETNNKGRLNSTIFPKSGLEGFLISLLNPKIAGFFMAIFSQFVSPETTIMETWIIGILAGSIDSAWYSSVALAITRQSFSSTIRNNQVVIGRLSGVFIIAVAVFMGLNFSMNLRWF